MYNVFADYAVTDQSISLDSVADEDETEEDEEKIDGNVWLLISSILLVVALLFAMLAIFVKDMLKKNRRSKVISKNNYNQSRAGRRTKRTVESKAEGEETEAETVEEVTEEVEVTETTETPAEEQEPAETVETQEVETETGDETSPEDDKGEQE